MKNNDVTGMVHCIIKSCVDKGLGAGLMILALVNPVPAVHAGEEEEDPTPPSISISAAEQHMCAVLLDGSVKCWGDNFDGELGNGTYDDSYLPVKVRGIKNAVSVAAGFDHSCALLSTGRVKCWGTNWAGQLGNRDAYGGSAVPVYVKHVFNAKNISAGDHHTCVTLGSKKVKCWGNNYSGQLGDNDPFNTLGFSAVTVRNIKNAKNVAAGHGHTCALLINGRVKCWGDNTYGQIGNGDDQVGEVYEPARVLKMKNVVHLDAHNRHSCAVLETGAMKCWGYNFFSQLGNRKTALSVYTPVDVLGINNAVMAAAGDAHTCAALKFGRVKCWGYNGGAFGNGTISASRRPVLARGITSATAIDASSVHSCAVVDHDTLKCWGDNFFGRLGNGTENESLVPIEVEL